MIIISLQRKLLYGYDLQESSHSSVIWLTMLLTKRQLNYKEGYINDVSAALLSSSLSIMSLLNRVMCISKMTIVIHKGLRVSTESEYIVDIGYSITLYTHNSLSLSLYNHYLLMQIFIHSSMELNLLLMLPIPPVQFLKSNSRQVTDSTWQQTFLIGGTVQGGIGKAKKGGAKCMRKKYHQLITLVYHRYQYP